MPLGIMFGAAAIGIVYPLIGLPGAEQNVIPRFASQWYVGKGAENKPTMQYLVKTQQAEFSAEMQFLDQRDDGQDVRVTIEDKKTGQHIEQTLRLGKAYLFVDAGQEIKPYTEHLETTVFWARDTILEPKYLVVGAEWGTIYIGKLTPNLVITQYEDTKFGFGSLKTYTASYKMNDVENKFWVSDNLPLPVKAEFYTLDGAPDYSFELINLEGTS